MFSLWLLLGVVLTSSTVWPRAGGVTIQHFYPFGPSVGDETVDQGDDISTNEINLPETVVFYNQRYRTIYVNVNGHVTFDSEVPSYRSDVGLPLGLSLIAVFFADVDTRGSGRIYYRSTSDIELIQRAARDIRTNFTGFEGFIPTSLFIVTWQRVGYYPEQLDRVNTFQLVLVSDGMDSFAVFHYLDQGIQWSQSYGKYAPTYDDIPPQAGFDGGESGLYYKLPGSGETGAFVSGSNVNVPGVWMHQIGNTGTGNVRPADLNIGEVTLFDVETTQGGCLDTSVRCHPQAQCVQYGDSPAVCCVCVSPFYGNGYHCLAPGVAQRVNGRVYGTLNGISWDEDLSMHTYALTTDGRTYTAISRVPLGLGAAIQTLNSIGGIIGWLFAVPISGKSINGYRFTGGRFNRTAKVTFQSSGRGEYVVRIFQVFYDHDGNNNIRMVTRLEGNLPELPHGATVSIDDYSENYKKTAPGTIKSFIDRTYRVNDVVFRYTWDNTITFEECQHHALETLGDVMRLTVTRQYVMYSEQDPVVRLAMTSKVGLFSGSDPCTETGKNCHQFADCIQYGNTHRCVCQQGFAGNGVVCQDIDECRRGPCDQHASCSNTPGSFQCQCLPGYVGDGRQCQANDRACGAVICHENAQCVFDEDRQESLCRCQPGYRGDGTSCSSVGVSCADVDICGEQAQCVYNTELREYQCECLDEFSGDDLTSCLPTSNECSSCSANATCVPHSGRASVSCVCQPGYTGDGRQCTLIETCIGCHGNAKCIFDDDVGDYSCVCDRGYHGDGTSCRPRDCRQDSSLCDPVGGVCWLDAARNFSFCRCNLGYKGDGLTCFPAGCDVTKDCDVNAECTAEGTRFSCRCRDGFEGDGKQCRPQQQQQHYACNEVNICDRHAECVYDPDLTSYICKCAKGFEGNGVSCIKKEIVDCRQNASLCSTEAECVQGRDEVFVCVCKTGYRGDGATCSHTIHEGSYLIYAQGNKLMKVSSEARPRDYGQQLVFIPGMLAVGVDIDCQQGDVYWTDAASGVIRRAQLDGYGVETIVTGLKSPEGIAIDPSARNMFFTDSERDTLQVARLDGSHLKTLVSTDMVNPRAIVLDINRGVVFWTDWNRNEPQIERMNMDGTQRKVLVSDQLKLPNGLAFDTFSQTLCWGDAGTQSIDCVRSDGEGRRVVYSRASYPFDLTFLNNIIYWTDWEKRDIPNINLNGGELRQALRQAVGGNGRTYGITAVLDNCPRARNSCGVNNGGCQYLCLVSARGGRTCTCPDGHTDCQQ